MTVDLTALPVTLDLPRALRDEVQRHLEAAMGWQVTTSGDLPARLHLHAVGRPAAAVPSILVVTGTDEPGAAATSALGADAVVAWPDSAAALPMLADRLLSTRAAPTVPAIRVAGAAGGVGATTVALALAGLMGWRGLEVLITSGSDIAVPDVPTVATLRGHRPWEVAVAVPGVPNLRALRAPAGVPLEVAGPDVVVDDVHDSAPHLLVVAADRAGLQAVRTSEAGAVILVERGPLPPAHVTAAAGARLAATMPWSDRVARAGLLRRVPASLPGSWLQRLAGLADRIVRDVHRAGDHVVRDPGMTP